MKPAILIIDDEAKLRQLLARIISLEGFTVREAGDAKSGLKLLAKEDIAIVLSDVILPDVNGIDLSKTIRDKHPHTEVIVLTAYGNIPDGIKAMKNGAFDYLVKGDDNDRIIPLLHKAIEKSQLQRRVTELENKLQKRVGFENVIGESKAIQQCIELAKKVAATDTAILLTGQTGTGKEVFSQAIHLASLRKEKSFVALNCAALGRDILESELFGYKAGAFTGAAKDKKGLLEEANGGTLFLDEIGEMNIELQAKLLRVLENGEFIRLGDTKTNKVSVRVIAATNRNLLQEIDAGHFRSDLYYRLSVFQIQLPALNERVKDIPLLANFFIQQASRNANKRIVGATAEFMEALKKHTWKGNIRELKNVIERAAIISEGPELGAEDLPYEFQSYGVSTENSQSAFLLSGVEKLHIQRVLNYTNGNKAEAARLLGIGTATLYRKLDEYKIQ
ncbi:MAG: sigma-54-dependent Fis family transcriptional regulator [Bacteroidetes bacterium]|nr:sigma-54-dependent Fis family transcriptional regulator [Bacteroidota bacterium]